MRQPPYAKVTHMNTYFYSINVSCMTFAGGSVIVNRMSGIIEAESAVKAYMWVENMTRAKFPHYNTIITALSKVE